MRKLLAINEIPSGQFLQPQTDVQEEKYPEIEWDEEEAQYGATAASPSLAQEFLIKLGMELPTWVLIVKEVS